MVSIVPAIGLAKKWELTPKCLFHYFISLPNGLVSMILFEFIFKKLLNLQIDEDILQEVIKMGFDRAALVESLRNRVQNEVTFLQYLCQYYRISKLC